MIIYTTEECSKWLYYRHYYGVAQKRYMFQAEIDGLKRGFLEECLDLSDNKIFHHNVSLIEKIVKHIETVYPQSIPVLDEMNIYLVPAPHASVCNAHMTGYEDMTVYGRPTQIPSFMTEYIISHEIGHAVQNYYCNEYKELWKEYLTLRNAPRGICKFTDYYDDENQKWIYKYEEDFLSMFGSREERNLTWDNSPIEWFAEDFRYIINYGDNQRWELTTIDKPSQKVFEFITNLKKEQ